MNVSKSIDELISEKEKEIQSLKSLKEYFDIGRIGNFQTVEQQIDFLVYRSEWNNWKLRDLFLRIGFDDEGNVLQDEEFSDPNYAFKRYKNLYYFRLPELINIRGFRQGRYADYMDFSVKDNVQKLVVDAMKKEKIDTIDGPFTVVFLIHYDKSKQRKDTDNYSLKKPIDGLGVGLLADDSEEKMHICIFTCEDEKAFTEMLVMPDHEMYERFIEVVKMYAEK